MKINEKSIFYSVSLLVVSNTVLQLLGFVYRICVSRMGGAEGMGVYRLVMPVYSIVMSISLSGICTGVTTLSSRMMARGNPAGAKKLVGYGINMFLVLFAAVAVPTALFHQFIADKILNDSRTAQALLVILVCIFLTGFENVLKSYFHGLKKVKYPAASEVTEQAVRIVITAAMLFFFSNGDHGRTALIIVLSMTISEIFSVVILTLAYRREERLERASGYGAFPRETGGILKSLIRFSVPVSFSALVCNLISSADTVILPTRLMAAGYTRSEALSSLGVIGGMVMPMIMLPSVFIGSLSTVLLPNIARSYAVGNREDINRKISKAVQVTGLIALPATALMMPLTPSLCWLLYRQTLHFDYGVLLCVACIFIYYQMISMSILNGIGQQKRAMIHLIVGEVIQLILTWFLAGEPAVHLYGYLAGAIIGPVLVCFLNFSLLFRCTGTVGSFHANVLLPLLSAVLVGMTARWMYLALDQSGKSAWVAVSVAMAGALMVYAILLALQGVQPLKYIRSLQVPKQ